MEGPAGRGGGRTGSERLRDSLVRRVEHAPEVVVHEAVDVVHGASNIFACARGLVNLAESVTDQAAVISDMPGQILNDSSPRHDTSPLLRMQIAIHKEC